MSSNVQNELVLMRPTTGSGKENKKNGEVRVVFLRNFR